MGTMLSKLPIGLQILLAGSECSSVTDRTEFMLRWPVAGVSRILGIGMIAAFVFFV